MANCPNCGRHLSFWEIKAECPACGVNIPNYNWEERLDEDARRAEQSWKKFRYKTGNLKSALFGNKFRTARFVFTFLPLAALVLPVINADISIPFVSAGEKTFSVLSFTLNNLTSLNLPSLLSLIGNPVIGASTLFLAAGASLLYIAVVFGVLNFVFVLIDAFSMKARRCAVLSGLAALCFTAAAVLFAVSLSGFSASSVNLFSGKIGYGLFVGIALFMINTIINIIAQRSLRKEISERSKT